MSERLQKIVENLDIQPDQNVLEIGCGQGVASSYVCEKLTTGQYVGIDRSAKMVEAAKKRNRHNLEIGKATFMQQALENLELGNQQFDVIFAVRVGLFYTQPEQAKQHVQKYLKADGKLITIFDPPS